MRYYSATISNHYTFGVTHDVTEAGIRLGYKRICLILGMDPDCRKDKRTAAQQRVVSGYGRFISLVKASQGLRSEMHSAAYTVSDLTTGTVCVFVALDRDHKICTPFEELSHTASAIGFDWKPPFERAIDRYLLARHADIGASSDALQKSAMLCLLGLREEGEPDDEVGEWSKTPTRSFTLVAKPVGDTSPEKIEWEVIPYKFSVPKAPY